MINTNINKKIMSENYEARKRHINFGNGVSGERAPENARTLRLLSGTFIIGRENDLLGVKGTEKEQNDKF